MRIYVCVKHVPDTAANIKVVGDNGFDDGGCKFIANPYDEYAVEQAVQLVEKNGGVGMNASTWTDFTQYFYSMPSNRLELWAYLEGSRMADIVLREFYTEKDGPVTEERRMRVDNSPMGKLFMEQFQNLAFDANGYHHSTIGYMSDLENISRADCQAYYDKHYVGKNMVVTIVGEEAMAVYSRRDINTREAVFERDLAFAMVDMAHDSHHRRATHLVLTFLL